MKKQLKVTRNSVLNRVQKGGVKQPIWDDVKFLHSGRLWLLGLTYILGPCFRIGLTVIGFHKQIP